ncbi:paramyosin-like isoform X1 [Tenebrio molitor]|uniref:paramyosin-like isoform X1 n=2 Tax=Tenebrio molitor TaxID=7067 RepID=UPI0036247632
MRKVLNKKFSSPSKLVGKVFQRHPNQKACDVDSHELPMTEDSSCLIKEIESLKEQIDSLKTALNTLKLDTESKEVKLAKLAREKEKLSMNLAKIRRSNVTLTQQLEDERNFYFKEKESYCHEMNEYKKLKRALSNSNVTTQVDNDEEIQKLRKTLEHTLQTNYNLSVKFLRMKETKNHLSNSLSKAEEEHRRVANDLKVKIDNLTSEMNQILDQKFDAPLSPSNKKYLQLVNQNCSLVYENLYLQTQVDQLCVKLRRSKIQRTKSETNSRIQHTCKERRTKIKTPKATTEEKIIKIFERDKKPGLPTVTILNEKEVTVKLHSSERKLQLPVVNESKLEVFQVSELQSRSSVSDVAGSRKRSRSAPKIVQSVSFKDASPSISKDEET